ncbi:hypothetical protein ACFOUP_12425 [Belliella kenyensis]|uniref:Natural product n=1 Tax=Belliella kenyensis TaxID=1472724 RepID=A0ABV8EME7_9BACT
MVSLEFEKDRVFPSITLIELGNLAMAQEENEDKCAGGSCTYTHYFSDEKLRDYSACCPFGKSPRCDTSGCQCW